MADRRPFCQSLEISDRPLYGTLNGCNVKQAFDIQRHCLYLMKDASFIWMYYYAKGVIRSSPEFSTTH